MKHLKSKVLVGLLTVAGMFGSANADVFNFDMLFDGTTVSLNAGSDNPVGTSLIAGDSFNLQLSAANDDFWRVDTSLNNQFVPLTFFVLDAGSRTGNVNTGFFLDGTEVFRINEGNVGQSSVHIGANNWTLNSGLEFDTVIMDYTLVSSTSSTTIQSRPNYFDGFGLSDSPFFDSDNITYEAGSVPEPATLTLLGAGLALFGRRRRKA